jgi:AraC family transcriptional regulator of adaptative response/methylated-DNA-[protein]-cysteine methyltransferase
MSANNQSEPIVYCTVYSSLGEILAAHSQRGVVAIALGDGVDSLTAHLLSLYPQAIQSADDCSLQQTLGKLVSHVDNPATALELTLDIRGTKFQQQVWQALRQIPAGTTQSYSQVARNMGAANAFRAVAAACAANRLALVIPCHRVISANGGLSGYRWGVERKQLLLDQEAKLTNYPVTELGV